MKKIIVIVIVLLVILSGVFIYKKLNAPPPKDFIILSGNVEADESNPGFKFAGKINKLYADEGDAVKQNQMLAKLENSDLVNTVAQNKAVVNEAYAHLADLQSGSRKQEIAQAEEAVSAAQADFTNAKKNYDRYDVLFKKGAVPAQQLDAAKEAYDTALAQYNASKEKLSLVKEGFRKDEITAAEHKLNQAKAALKIIEEKLKDSVLYSPIDGVVRKKNFEEGDVVSAGIPVYTIDNLNSLYIKVYVNETKIGLVKLGQKAEIAVDSYPDKKYEGSVTFISSEAEFTPKNIQTQEERVKLTFEVKIKIDNQNNELKPGMPTDVKILIK